MIELEHATLPKNSADIYRRQNYFDQVYGQDFFSAVCICSHHLEPPAQRSPEETPTLLPLVNNPWIYLSEKVAVNTAPVIPPTVNDQQLSARNRFFEHRIGKETLYPTLASVQSGEIIQHYHAGDLLHYQRTPLSIYRGLMLVLSDRSTQKDADFFLGLPRHQFPAQSWWKVEALLTGSGSPKHQMERQLATIAPLAEPQNLGSARFPAVGLKPLNQATITSFPDSLEHPRLFGLPYDNLKIVDNHFHVLQDWHLHNQPPSCIVFNNPLNTITEIMIAHQKSSTLSSQRYASDEHIKLPLPDMLYDKPSSVEAYLLGFMIGYGQMTYPSRPLGPSSLLKPSLAA